MNTLSDPRECPYVGLDPFEISHTDYFFGRSRDSKIIVDHVCARPVTVLYGPSGVGKSSILNVGLPAALAHRRGWMIAMLRDWQDPDSLEQLAVEAVLGALPNPPHRPVDRLGLAPLIGWATRTTGRRLVLVFDQFEEYFLYRDRDRMRSLEVEMGDLVLRRDLPLHLLVALRDGALYRLDELRAIVPGILDTTIKLSHLDDASVEEAILGPVDRYNQDYRAAGCFITVEDQLVSTLKQQLKETGREEAHPAKADHQPIELAYLQLALTKLWAAEGGANATALRETTLTNELGSLHYPRPCRDCDGRAYCGRAGLVRQIVRPPGYWNWQQDRVSDRRLGGARRGRAGCQPGKSRSGTPQADPQAVPDIEAGNHGRLARL
jgi:hypothetical protein